MKKPSNTNKWLIVLTLVFIVAMCFYGVYHTLVLSSIDLSNYVVEVDENVTIFFAPGEYTLDSLLQEINASTKEVHCALRSLNHDELEQMLFALEESGVKVRLFIDHDYMGNSDLRKPYVQFSESKQYGMMHNNYCILDQERVFTGSLIFNQNTIENNIHDVVLVNSKELAADYNRDFWKMYLNGSNQSSHKSLLYDKSGWAVQAHFCPYSDCRSHVVSLIDQAQHSIEFAHYAFSDTEVKNALQRAQSRGVKVKGVVDTNGVTPYSIIHQEITGIEESRLAYRVHTKIFVIDKEIVITGSTNPTPTGFDVNEENLLTLYHKEAAQAYTVLLNDIFVKS